MKLEREPIKKKLGEELQDIHFTQAANVIERTSPKTWVQRFRVIWNKEIELPLIPVSAAFLLIIIVFLYPWQPLLPETSLQQTQSNNRQLIKAAGNTYWKDDFEKMVAYNENKNKN